MDTKVSNKITYISVGGLEDFHLRIGRVIRIHGMEIAIFRTSDDELFAVENKSPHRKGGPLAEGIVSGHMLFDPLYDLKISLETGLVQAPDNGQVRTFPVQLIGNKVLLGLTNESLEPAALR